MIAVARLDQGRTILDASNEGSPKRPGWWAMNEELRISYEVKDLITDLGVKIDKLADGVAAKANVAEIVALGTRLDALDGRLDRLEEWRWKWTGALSIMALAIGLTASTILRHVWA